MGRDVSSLAHRTVSNAGWAGACRVLTGIVSLVTVPVFIERLGATSYGLYVLIQSLLGVTGLFNLGFGEAAIKYVAEADGRSDTSAMIRYFRNALAVSLAVTAGVFALLIFVADVLADKLLRAGPGQRQIAVASLTWFGIAWMGRNINGALATLPAARQRYDRVVLIREGAVVLERLLALAVLGLGGGLVAVFQSQIVPQVVAGALFALAARSVLPGVSLIPRFDSECLSQSLRFGVWQSLSNVFYELSNSVDRWMVGALVSTRAVGYYGAVQVVTNGVWGILTGLASVLIPTFSYLQGRRDDKRVTAAFLTSSWSLGLIGTVLCVPLIWYSRPFLTLWIGPAGAQEAHAALVLSLLAQTLLGAAAAQACFLVGTGRTAWNARIALGNIILTTAINAVALPMWGSNAMGASRIGIALYAAFNLALMRSRALASPEPSAYFGSLFGPPAIGLLCGGIGLALANLPVWVEINSWPRLAAAAMATSLGIACLNLILGSVNGGRTARLQHLRQALGSLLRGPVPS